MELTAMDYVRSALATGILEGVTIDDLLEVALEARSVEDWEDAVSLLAQTQPASCVIADIAIL